MFEGPFRVQPQFWSIIALPSPRHCVYTKSAFTRSSPLGRPLRSWNFRHIGYSASCARRPNADVAAPLGLRGQNPVTQYIFSADWCSTGLSTLNIRVGRSSLCHHPDTTDAVFTSSSSLARPPLRPWVSAAWSHNASRRRHPRAGMVASLHLHGQNPIT